MTRDDIEHMVREAGIKTGFVLHMTKWDKATWLFMRRFAVLVAAAEREACAKLCEEEIKRVKPLSLYSVTAENCVKAIRARGQK